MIRVRDEDADQAPALVVIAQRSLADSTRPRLEEQAEEAGV